MEQIGMSPTQIQNALKTSSEFAHLNFWPRGDNTLTYVIDTGYYQIPAPDYIEILPVATSGDGKDRSKDLHGSEVIEIVQKFAQESKIISCKHNPAASTGNNPSIQGLAECLDAVTRHYGAIPNSEEKPRPRAVVNMSIQVDPAIDDFKDAELKVPTTDADANQKIEEFKAQFTKEGAVTPDDRTLTALRNIFYINLLMERLDTLNMAVVASAGNRSGQLHELMEDWFTEALQPPFLMPSGVVAIPASYRKVYAVGSLDAKGTIAQSSNYGRRVQVYLRGHMIKSLIQKGKEISGTSFAAPIFASLIADMFSPGSSVKDTRTSEILQVCDMKKITHMVPFHAEINPQKQIPETRRLKGKNVYWAK